MRHEPSKFSNFARNTAKFTGRPATFALSLAMILAWAITGPIFKFSDTWQLVINTSTTIITFLMVFIIQNTQNRDTEALHLKLDELILMSSAKNDFISLEELSEEELDDLQKRFTQLASQARKVDSEKSEKRRTRKRAS